MESSFTPQASEEHVVQFYDQDPFLIETVAHFVGAALGAGEGAVVIATEEHRKAIDELLCSRGLDVSVARASGLYVPLDAEETLASFMVDGWPDRTLFGEVIGGVIRRASAAAPRVKAFGEMVALLWARDQREAAIRLEEMWCNLVLDQRFSLLCAYPMASFARGADRESFQRVCSRHDRVVPAESYTGLVGEEARLREVTHLQQKARALETEVMHRSEVERTLEERSEMLHAMVDASPTAIAVLDADETVRLWNRAAERLFGVTEAEVLGQPLPIVPAETPESFAVLRTEVLRGTTFNGIEVQRVRKDGSSIDLVVSAAPLAGRDGKQGGILFLYEDVTQRKRLEESRQKSHRELAILYHIGQVLAGELDLERLLQSVTDAARELCGAQHGAFFYNAREGEPGDLLLNTLSGVPHPILETITTPRIRELFSSFSGSGAVRMDDVSKDSRYGWTAPFRGLPASHLPITSYLAAPVVGRSGEVVGGLFLGHPEPGAFSEESERVVVALASQVAIAIDNARLYDAERRARGEAEAASRAKDEFLAMLGHELRNPLSTVQTAISTARLDGSQRDRALEVARRGVDQLGRLVDDLLDVARITQGRISLKSERLRAGSVIERAVETARALIDERQHEVRMSLEASDVYLEGDATRLEQILVNLLNNAAKYTDPGGCIDVSVKQASGEVFIQVRDNGMGIAPDMLPRVFELFSQSDRALDRSQGGLGIGLTLVKRLVELHGGRVEARSDGLGRGADFTIRLPAASPPAPAVAKPPANEGRHAYARILVVEDNVDAAEGLMMLLEVLGHRVRVANDGPSALETALAESPDVMLVDIGLPGMDGYEVARRIRDEPSLAHVTLVALTGYGSEEDRQRAIGAGFDHHLVKPIDLEKLSGLVGGARSASSPASKTLH